jgi:hypothetical protein
MAESPTDPNRAPEFPFWPYNYMSLYSHMARDFSRYAQAASKSTDPMEAARAEGDFGMRLFTDLMQGYVDLALAPWTAMASVMAERAKAADPAPPAPAKPKTSRDQTAH